MKKPFCAAAVIAALFATTAQAQTIGVNYTIGNRNTPAVMQADLANMAASGVKVIRVPLEKMWGSYSGSVTVAKLAAAIGIQTHFVVSLSSDPDFYPAGTQERPADPNNPSIWASYPFSKLLPGAVAQAVANVLSQLAAAGVTPLAIEVGNEVNNPGFNGDLVNTHLPATKAGVVLGIADLEAASTPETQAIAKGFQLVVAATAAVRQISGGIPVVSAGLFIPPGWYPGKPDGIAEDTVALADTFAYLRAQGLDQAADMYGVHSYPGGSATQTILIEQMALGPCMSGTLPCAVTEWGYQNGPAQPGQAQQWMAANPGIAEALWFDWKGQNYGVWQNGALSVTGQTVLNWSTGSN